VKDDAMTRSRTYLLTVIAAILYVLLCWIFADGLFKGNWWNSDAIASSNIWTYVLLAAIIVAGVAQAQRLPAGGIVLRHDVQTGAPGQVEDPVFWRLLVGNTYYAILWLPLRFFSGRDWLEAGESKLRSDAWMDGGTALKGFWTNAVTVPEGKSSSAAGTYDWFNDFLNYMLKHEWYTWFAKLIAVGETLVGLGIIFGALVGIAAFFGTLMNFNFELAGSASSNPVMFGLGVFLVLGWKVAGWWGLDRWLLPRLGTPWGRLEQHQQPHRASDTTAPPPRA
jgi:thiosulfate dehydrogenase [quinone] large subunit